MKEAMMVAPALVNPHLSMFSTFDQHVSRMTMHLLDDLVGLNELKLKTQEDPHMSTESFWMIGVAINLVGATLTAVGLLLQKYSHNTTSKLDDQEAKKRKDWYFLEARWLGGTAVWILGNIVCWVASGLAPQSLLSGLGVWNIVASLAAGFYFFGEPVTQKTLIGAGMLVFGCFWVILSGPREYQTQTVKIIEQELTHPVSIAIALTTAAFLTYMAVVSAQRRADRRSSLTSMEYVSIAASFAWYACIFSRSMAALLVTSVRQWDPEFATWLFWALLVGFLASAVLNMHFLNQAMKVGDVTVVFPTYTAMAMTGEIVLGGLFFREFVSLGLVDHLLFWPAVLFVLLGVGLISMQDQGSKDMMDKPIRCGEDLRTRYGTTNSPRIPECNVAAAC
eukprot:TRINITY_DN64672_c0_g1_i1.p1 TRINITY_DN64672_c0_g1~~TRINITY_DN64672_c0_g1_i1.p1  ORF type:complete len:393 (+),score=59.25 TRINITY_DN64672_c0_g1_i1:180-1358(+)